MARRHPSRGWCVPVTVATSDGNDIPRRARQHFLSTSSSRLALTPGPRPTFADIQLPAGVATPADDTEEPIGVDPNAPEKWTDLGLQNVGR